VEDYFGQEDSTTPSPVEGPPAPPRPATYKSVRGWLMFFCLTLVLFAPAATLLVAVQALGQLPLLVRASAQFPGLLVITIVDLILSTAIMGFSIYAGLALMRVRPNAVRIAKTFLLVRLGYSLLELALPLVAGLPASARSIMLQAIAGQVVVGVLYVAIWYSYLTVSKRVKRTYAPTVTQPAVGTAEEPVSA
jgi:hypothetical protein